MPLPKEVQEILEKMLGSLTLKEKETLSSFLQGYLSVMPGNSILENMQEELGHSIQAEVMEQDWKDTEWMSSDGLTEEEVAIDNENYLLELEGK